MKENIEDIFPALIGKSDDERDLLLNKLLDRAWEIRTFEVDLYWKRATYFWVFIGATFVAFYETVKEDNIPGYFRLLIICLGLVFSFSWYCVNRGSKYWMENWEAKVNLIETELCVKLNSLQFNPDNEKNNRKGWDDFWLGRRQYSVTKINTLVSLFTCFIWLYLIYENYTFCFTAECFDIGSTVVLLLTFLFCFWIYKLKNSIKKEPEMNNLL